MTDLGSDVHLKPGASIIHRLLFDVTNPYDDLRLSVFNNPELSDPIPIPIPR